MGEALHLLAMLRGRVHRFGDVLGHEPPAASLLQGLLDKVVDIGDRSRGDLLIQLGAIETLQMYGVEVLELHAPSRGDHVAANHRRVALEGSVLHLASLGVGEPPLQVLPEREVLRIEGHQAVIVVCQRPGILGQCLCLGSAVEGPAFEASI